MDGTMAGDASTAKQNIETFLKAVLPLGYRSRRNYIACHKYWDLPRFIYKFRTLDPASAISIDRLRDLVVRSKLWLSSPLDFNDPFDMQAQTIVDGTAKEQRDRLEQILERQGMGWGKRQRTITDILRKPEAEFREIASGMLRETVERVGICSFGGDPRSILMWSHYSSHHKGVSLQFEPIRDPATFFRLIAVKYSDDYPEILWTTNPDPGIDAMITTKHRGWAYEKEIRLVFPENSRQFISFDSAALQGIIIGCEADDASNEVLRQLLKERAANGLNGPNIYRVVKHEASYELIIHHLKNL
jgi:hypothetical protein